MCLYVCLPSQELKLVQCFKSICNETYYQAIDDMYHKLYLLHITLNDITNVLFAAPSEPQSLEVVSVNSSSVTLQWMPPNILNGTIRQYSIQFDGDVINNFGNNMLMGTVEGLSPESVYTLQLRAHTGAGAGAGPPSSIIVITCKLLNTITCYVYLVTV